MFVRSIGSSLLVLLFVSQLSAQAPKGPAPASDDAQKAPETLLQDRLKLVRDVYSLDQTQLAELRTALLKRVPEQSAYRAGHALTIDRLHLCITLVGNDKRLSSDDRAKRIAAFTKQVNTINLQAPMSLANVIKHVESMLPRQQIDAGHKRLAARFAGRLEGRKLDIEKIDALVAGPIEVGTAPLFPQSKPEPAPQRLEPAVPQKEVRPQVQTTVKPQPQKRTEPIAAKPETVKPATARTPPPASASKPKKTTGKDSKSTPTQKKVVTSLQPALPVSEWARYAERTEGEYAFTDAQRAVAKSILKSCRTRADKHLAENKAAYDEARTLENPKIRNAKQRELDRTLDKLFNELSQRLDSVATIEQRLKAKKADPKAEPQQASKKPASAVKKEKESPKDPD